jgi:hypothetical protein
MSARLRTLSTAALLTCLIAAAAAAQDVPLPASAPPPANLAFVEGTVDHFHDGVADRAASATMLLDGDLVRTGNGRAEIVFADGTLLHLDHDTEIELLSPLRLRLSAGRVLLRVSAAATAPYIIDTQAAAVRFDPRGEYGLTADGRLERLELTVARGVAELDDAGTRTVVRGGEMATILGPGGRVLLQAFNSARWDGFDRWSNDRANGFATAASSRQLPQELRAYGPVLDGYGRWDYIAPHGNVWFPAVGADWRPYYTGAWNRTRYGWTWIGHDPWAWPTHHFGRWGYTGASWYWIPNRVWGPAWVSWSFLPGYVSWCPLGWDGRAVVGFSAAQWRVSGRRGDHPAYYPTYDPWRAWTVVPRDSFGGRRAVRSHAIDPMRLPEETRRVFAGNAVPRAEAPALPADVRGPASAVDYAVPRGDGIPSPRPSSAPRDYDAPRRGFVRNPNVAPAPPASARPEPRVSPGEPSPSNVEGPPPAIQGREGARTAPVYGRGVERRTAPAQEQPVDDAPRGYVPRSGYARPRSEPSPPATAPAPAQTPAPAASDRPRGEYARPRSQGESRPAQPSASPPPPPRQSSGSEGQAQGGAVRRRPPR